ncbi:unnamed protein product, partial [marine sediment metagenome]
EPDRLIAQMFISPEGQRFTLEQMETQWAEAERYQETLRTPELLYKEYQRTGGELPEEEWRAIGAPYRPFTEQVFGRVFPERDIDELLASMVTEGMPEPERLAAEKAQEEFVQALWDIGRTKDTEALLRQLGASEEQLEEFFAPAVPEVLEIPEELMLPSIPPEGITYTVDDKEGKPLELHILEDFEYVPVVGGYPERQLKSPDYPVYHEGTHIGTFLRETGEFVPRNWTWWEKTLGIGVQTLQWVFYVPNVVGMMTRDIWERFKIWPWLPAEERDRLHA